MLITITSYPGTWAKKKHDVKMVDLYRRYLLSGAEMSQFNVS